MADRAVQMYRIAAATGSNLRTFSSGQWDVLLALVALDGVSDGADLQTRADSLLAASETLGIRREAEVVLEKVTQASQHARTR